LYCIQKGNYLTKNNFTLENLDKLYEWVSKPIIEKKRDITINIFGGEPTLNIKGVLYFLEKMNVLANKLKVKKYYQMVTNGYLLNQEIIKKLYDLGVSDFQITLDGVKEEHDRRRSVVFKSFDKIVENIILINKLGGIVYILHVFDESNINSGKKLVDYFDEISNIHSLSKNTIYFNFVVTIPKKTELV
ncbi:radical SAM protein, partial [Treponema pedis]|uniref:radical SAM protein n=1 Tax=Treponema pedis TaxID=409322 RepID=UPI0004674E79